MTAPTGLAGGPHDVLVVGAGLAGMRAAIEAFDEGADVAIVSKLQHRLREAASPEAR